MSTTMDDTISTSTSTSTSVVEPTSNNPNTCTAQERRWAIDIKNAVAADSELRLYGGTYPVMSDLDFLQHAIVAKGDVPAALQRIRKLQSFQTQNGIQSSAVGSTTCTEDNDDDDESFNTESSPSSASSASSSPLEKAERDLKAFLAVHGGLYRSLSELDDGTHVLTVEYSRLKARSFRSDESWAIRRRGLFHVLQATQPHVRAMRAGMVSLCNMKGVTVRKNFSFAAQRQFNLYISKTYPVRIQQIALLQTIRLVAILYGLVKHFVSAKIRQRTVFDGGTLEDFFQRHAERYPPHVLPRAWGGTLADDDNDDDSDDSQRSYNNNNNDAFLATVMEKLRQRHELEQTFRLEEEKKEEE